MTLTTNQLLLRNALWATEQRVECQTGTLFELSDWLAILLDTYGEIEVEAMLRELKENQQREDYERTV